MRQAALVLRPEALLATAACSGNTTPARTDPVSAGPVVSGSAEPIAAPTAPPAGRYRLDRFVGAGARDNDGTCGGGDVTLAFTDRVQGAGQDTIRLTLAGGTGNLTMNGSVRGTYTGTGSTYDFTVEKSTGSATLSAAGQQQLSIEDAASLLAPRGRAVLACNPPKMVLLLPAVRLDLSRR